METATVVDDGHTRPGLRVLSEFRSELTDLRTLFAQQAVLTAHQGVLIAQLQETAARPDLLSEREVAIELRKGRDSIRRWKRSGKLKTVDTGGRFPMFRRADIERIKEEGKSALTRRSRRSSHALSQHAPPEPLESMLARMDAKRTKRSSKSPANEPMRAHQGPLRY